MKALVTAPLAPLMSEPRRECELADEVMAGSVVETGEELGGYVRVTTEYRYSGWVPRECLLMEPERAQDWLSRPLHWVERGSLDVQEHTRVQAWQLTTLPRGARVRAWQEEEGWSRVELPDGSVGHVRSSGLRPVETVPWQQRQPMELRAALVRTALTYLGTQYRWGGKTAWGIDCSGLCSVSYLMQGISIHRDANLLEGFPLKPIARDRMAEGDLIFFPGHVAMYIGSGKYIHATAAQGSDGVVINSLLPGDGDFRQDLLDSITQIGSLF